MYNNLLRMFTNAVYLVPWQVRKFQKRNPDQQVLAAGATKARKMNREGKIQHELGWITAKRNTLILTDRNLVCGSWVIPLETVTEATLLQFTSTITRAKAFVLKVKTAESYYQFGMQYDQAWLEQTALKMSVEKGKLGHSVAGLVLRLAAFAYLIWIIVDRFL